MLDDQIENVLGTPTSQKIIRLLVVWKSLNVQDLAEKSRISKPQIHTTMRKLKDQNMVVSPSRGSYTITDTPFMNLLKKAYYIRIVELINQQLYTVNKLLRVEKGSETVNTENIEKAHEIYNYLVQQYNPILRESFKQQLNSLSHQFIDAIAGE